MKKLFLIVLLSFGMSAFAAPLPEHKIENFSEYYKQDCSFVAGEKSDANDWCNRGNAAGGAPNVVIIGDSYSNSVTTIFEEYARTSSKQIVYEQYGHGRCPELLGVGPKGCGDFAQTVYERVKKTPSIKTVVLAAHWVWYFAQKHQWDGDAKVYTREEVEKSFADTIKAYQALGKKVVFVYQAPELDDPKVCAQRRIRIAATQDKCHMSREWGWRNEGYRPFVDPILARLKVETFDPFAYMCNATECQVKDGDKIFFASGQHLSGFGGQYLAQKAAPDLKKLLGY